MLEREELLQLVELAKRTPGRPHASTLWRWCTRGFNGVRLEYRKVGRRIFSSLAAMERFSCATAEADPPPSRPSARQRLEPRHRDKADRSPSLARAEATLRRAGI